MSRGLHQHDTEAIRNHLRNHARKYYPQAADAELQVQLARSLPRRFSALYEFTLSTPAWRQAVLAKVTRDGNGLAGEPSLSAIESRFVASLDRRGAEWEAMSAWEAHVAQQAEPRLFVVRMLDSLLGDRALLMERAAAVPLTKLLRSASRWGGSAPPSQLLRAMERAGVALRTLHRMPAIPHCQERGVRRSEFLDWLAAAEPYFGSDAAALGFYRQIAPRIRTAALELLADELPCGPLHNDFAPRNVLIDDTGRVAVIDMLGQWSGCVWEDVGHFLASLAACKPQALTGGRWFSAPAVAALRRSLLAGYAEGAAIDERVVRLFEAQAVLTMWAAKLHIARHARAFAKLKLRLPLTIAARWYARWITDCLASASSRSSVPAASPSAALVAGGAL